MEPVREGIRRRAEVKSTPFEKEVLEMLGSEGFRNVMTPAERTAEFDRIRAMTPQGVKQTDSTDIIRELRDRGYSSLTQNCDDAGR